MKKISFKNLQLNDVDQLSREQLKSVLGGNSASMKGGRCDSDADCPVGDICDENKHLCYNNSTGYAVPCPTSDGSCITRDGVAGTCGNYGGIYGCH